ncbi:MAG TPA: TolC family protein [Myxococcales bacterium]|jgi:outer membrane protein
MKAAPISSRIAVLALSLLLPALARAQAAPLTLAEAEDSARTRQPDLARARSNTAAAAARVEQAYAPLLPQLATSAGYALQTNNSTAVPGNNSWAPTNRFTFAVSASETIWDFGSNWYRYKASGASLESQKQTEATQLSLAVLQARASFFQARAGRALVKVAEENLASQLRHLEQIDGFVRAGTRPEIDLAQVRADVANARLQLVNAQNTYAQAKAELNQAMGVERSTEYEVADEQLPALEGEDASEEALVEQAVKTRPEMHALEQQAVAQGLQIRSTQANYWPSVGVSTGLNNVGIDSLVDTAWNWNLGATLTWSFYTGGSTRAQVRELEAGKSGLEAQLSSQRQQVRLEVVKARLGLVAAKASVEATAQAVENTRQRQTLAEARYQAGVGSILELQDAQVAGTNAQGQAIQAAFNVSLARAQLLRALGRD